MHKETLCRINRTEKYIIGWQATHSDSPAGLNAVLLFYVFEEEKHE